MKTLILTLLLTTLSLSAFAKVELFTEKKTPIDPEKVVVTTVGGDKFKNCEEMGIIHSQAFWGGFSTKKGMLKRMKRQVGKVGGTHILLRDTGHQDNSGSNVGNGTVFYCKS